MRDWLTSEANIVCNRSKRIEEPATRAGHHPYPSRPADDSGGQRLVLTPPSSRRIPPGFCCSVLTLHSRNDQGLSFRAGVLRVRAARAPVITGAGGSLDAELPETILAGSGMEDGLISCSDRLFSVLRTSQNPCRRACTGFVMARCHPDPYGGSCLPFRSIADAFHRQPQPPANPFADNTVDQCCTYYPLERAAPGTYVIPITATDPATGLSHSVSLTLIVTP